MTHAPTVLVVDDEAAFRESLRILLEYEGMIFHSVGDVASGLRRMRETLYDLVVIDAGIMRRQSPLGADLIGWIRGGAPDGDKWATPRTVPIILISGGTSAIQLREVLPSVEAFLDKPFSSEDLVGMIFRLFPSPLHPAAAALRHAPSAHADWTSWMDDFGELNVSIGCVSLDVDRRSIRYRAGRPAFYDVLPEIARLVEQRVRYRGHAYAQAGAGESLLLLPNQSIEEARLVAEHLRSNLATHTFRVGTEDLSLTVSVGVASAPTHGTDFGAVRGAARAARWEATFRGGNEVVVAALPGAVSLAPLMSKLAEPEG